MTVIEALQLAIDDHMAYAKNAWDREFVAKLYEAKDICSTKLALRREEGFPVGQPAPLYLVCLCGVKVHVEQGLESECLVCGRRFDDRGFIKRGESIGVCLAGEPAINGVCGDPECICWPKK